MNRHLGKKPSSFWPVATATALLGIALGACGGSDAATSELVTLRFSAVVGDEQAECGRDYDGLGADGTQAQVADARLFVSGVSLRVAGSGQSAEGEAVEPRFVPLELTETAWQHNGVALLDFENGSESCSDSGTAETNVALEGKAPSGSYDGARFTLGVPFEMNHVDNATAPAPMNVPGMFWVWRGGYKFARVDFQTTTKGKEHSHGREEHGDDVSDAHDEGEHEHASGEHGEGEHADSEHRHGAEDDGESDQSGFFGEPGHGSEGEHDHGAHAGNASRWNVHVGSTGCVSNAPTEAPEEPCGRSNRAEITLIGFDPASTSIQVDLAALVAGAAMGMNAEETPPGCMSDPGEASDCSAVFSSLGLDFETGDCVNECASQTVFSAAKGD